MMIKLSENIGADIRFLREAQNMSQSRLAIAARITQPYLSRIENGTSEPNWVVVLRCLEGLGYAIKAERGM